MGQPRLSRARHGTTLHAVADDLDQARQDLALDWANDQHQRWVTDTATPTQLEPVPTHEERQLVGPQRRAALYDDLRDLHAGAGRWQSTPEGEAARHLNDVRQRLDDARRRSASPTAGRRDRRAAVRECGTLTPALDAAEQRWNVIGEPVAVGIRQTIAEVEEALERDDLARLRRQVTAVRQLQAVDPATVEPHVSVHQPSREGLGLRSRGPVPDRHIGGRPGVVSRGADPKGTGI